MVIVLVHIYASPLYFTAVYYLIQHTLSNSNGKYSKLKLMQTKFYWNFFLFFLA